MLKKKKYINVKHMNQNSESEDSFKKKLIRLLVKQVSKSCEIMSMIQKNLSSSHHVNTISMK